VRQREWLDRQRAEHPWRTLLVVTGGLAAVYVTVRLVDWQASIDARQPRRRTRPGGGQPSVPA
jgi:hypothetical protein